MRGFFMGGSQHLIGGNQCTLQDWDRTCAEKTNHLNYLLIICCINPYVVRRWSLWILYCLMSPWYFYVCFASGDYFCLKFFIFTVNISSPPHPPPWTIPKLSFIMLTTPFLFFDNCIPLLLLIDCHYKNPYWTLCFSLIDQLFNISWNVTFLRLWFHWTPL